MGEGERLAKLVAHRRTLLVLDGLEPLQNPPGPQEGRLREPSLQAFLRELAAFNTGLCLITTRIPVADIANHERTSARLHLLKNVAYLNSSPSCRKYLPVIYDKQSFDPKEPIWHIALDQIIKDHILALFSGGVEEGEKIDYKESGCLSSKADTAELLKDFAAMANASGGIIIIGIRDSDGRPAHPLKAGLQSIRNVDQQIIGSTK